MQYQFIVQLSGMLTLPEQRFKIRKSLTEKNRQDISFHPEAFCPVQAAQRNNRFLKAKAFPALSKQYKLEWLSGGSLKDPYQ